MAKKEFVQLAHTFDPGKHLVAGAYASQKLDGERAIWDGGASRGFDAEFVPYANTIKDARRKRAQIATGLWSRTGKIIFAPDWFLALLPPYPLDGELWAGVQNWQQLSSIVHKEFPDDRWRLVEFKIIDSPPIESLFAPREVKVRGDYTFEIKANALEWVSKRIKNRGIPAHWNFEFAYRWLMNRFPSEGQVSLIPQIELPFNNFKAIEKLGSFVEEVVDDGGEGVVIRRRTGLWTPERSWDLLKYKPYKDAEATVIGYFAGKETDKGSKLLGKVGAFEVDYQGTIFKLSGFTDAERILPTSAEEWAAKNPGSRLPEEFQSSVFPRGSTVTFRYRELSDDGTPKEARYLRSENDE